MAKLSQIKLGTTTYDIGAKWENITEKPSNYLPYGVCSTAAGTAAKTVTVSNVDSFELKEGTVIAVKFTESSGVASPTLNVNDTGAKSIVRYGTTAASTGTSTTGWRAGAVQVFIYDGTSWVRDFWENTTYSNVSLGHGYATCSTAEATTAKTASLSSYALTTGGIVAVKFTNAVPASATLNINGKGAKAIYHKGAAIAAGVIKAGDTATFIYSSQYHLISLDRDTNTTYSAGTGLSLSGTTFNHSNSVTAATAKGSDTKTLTFGGTFALPTVSYNAQGHITGSGTTTMTMPSNPTVQNFDRETSNYKDGIVFYKSDKTTRQSYIGFWNTAGIILNPSYQSKESTTDPWTTSEGLCIGETSLTFNGSSVLTASSSNYIKSLSISGKTITYTKGDNTTGTLTTQDTTYTAGTGISISSANAISNSGVRSISTGSTNGTISVNTNGSSANVAVKGLGSAAYTASTAYDAAGAASTAESNAKSYTDTAIANLVDSAPSTLNTLNELAAALGDDANFATTVANNIADKVSKSATGVQTIAGGLVIGATSTSGISGTGKGRIMFTGQTNPLIGVQAIDASGNAKTPYYIQSVASDDKLYIGPTSTKALSFDSEGNMASPANLSVGGTISEGGTSLSEKYAAKSHGTHVSYGTSATAVGATASAGSATTVSRSDHTHSLSKSAVTTALGYTPGTSSLTIGTTSTTAAAGNHTHSSYVNQNAFSNVKVGETTVAADSATDTLTLVAGNNITLTPDATNDKITIAATDTVYTHPTSAGNKHIPAGGSSGQILRWSAAGTATWGTDTDTNYYHTRVYSSGLKISTGTGVSDMYVPSATGSQSGVVIMYPAASCTSFTSEDGTCTVAAVKKAVTLFTNDYAPTLTGGGASGTWGISITGNAATATYADSAGTCTSLSTNAGSTTKAIYFSGGKPAQCNDTINHNVSGYSASLAYPTQITTDANIDGFLEANRFKVGTWNSTSSPGVTNGIILSGGWTNANYGFQIAIDDDPTYFLALRQKDSTGWKDWKRIPMADGTGASGTWSINIGGTAAASNKLNNIRSIGTSSQNHAEALQSEFNSNKASVPRNSLATYYSSSYGNGSFYQGYFLTNYDSNPYGGFYVCHYNTPYYVGIQNGSFTQFQLWKSGDAVTGAVWNDYAECRESNCIDAGYVLTENGDDTLSKTTERLSSFAGVSSDTWGFSQGETDKAKTHIAVAGRALVYPYQDRNNYKPGDCVCAAPGGTVDIMTREEVINWPDRIVGTVSCVPDYEEWGGGNDRDPVKVNGRIWIKVR